MDIADSLSVRMKGKKMKSVDDSHPGRTIWGFHPTDLLGILIMIIPFCISLKEFSYVKGTFLWWNITGSETIQPGMVSALCAVVFYIALILRCQLFKVGTFAEGFVSVIRAFLNCWVIASLMTMIVPTKGISVINFLKNWQSTLLLLGIVLSWLGMRTVSGYCWILFIIPAWKRILTLDSAMHMWGALYIITIAISLLLQITNYVKLSDLLQDFKGEISKHSTTVKANINLAAKDAQNRAQRTADYVMANVVKSGSVHPSFHVSKTGATRIEDKNPKPSQSVPAGDTRDLLKALDVNGDGVIDEKDIDLLRK